MALVGQLVNQRAESGPRACCFFHQQRVEFVDVSSLALCISSANASLTTSLLRSTLSAPCGVILRHSSIRTLPSVIFQVTFVSSSNEVFCTDVSHTEPTSELCTWESILCMGSVEMCFANTLSRHMGQSLVTVSCHAVFRMASSRSRPL